MAITLYTWPRSSGSKVHWALEELGLPYELRVLDRAKREHKEAAYLAIHPNGKVPALRDGEEVVFESGAILIHLGQRYGLWHRDALSWTVWCIAELAPYMMQLIYHGLDSPVSYAPDQRSQATAAYNRANHREHLAMLEARLEGRDHLLGDFSLVDVAAADTLATGRALGLTIESPRVEAWLERCLARPARRRVA